MLGDERVRPARGDVGHGVYGLALLLDVVIAFGRRGDLGVRHHDREGPLMHELARVNDEEEEGCEDDSPSLRSSNAWKKSPNFRQMPLAPGYPAC